MPMFRKKPVVIEAMQWTGKNLRAVKTFTDGPPNTRSMHSGMRWMEYEDLVKSDGLMIHTLEGQLKASIGDWIIKGTRGEHWPVRSDIFNETYEPT
jgi:hypothetical protein